MAKRSGLTVIATTRNQEKVIMLLEKGADHVLVDDVRLEPKLRPMEFTPATVHVTIYDSARIRISPLHFQQFLIIPLHMKTRNGTSTTITARTAGQQFAEDVLAGLCRIPKNLHAKYFYDKEGDALFQQIMACPEYYLTRCELEIFQSQTGQLADIISASQRAFNLIELGAGDATKSQYLLDELVQRPVPFTYMPIDISGNILSVLGERLRSELPGLDILPLEGEYLDMLQFATERSPRRNVVMFLGSNIGNMHAEEALGFCKELRSLLHPGDLALIGFDLKKHPKIILHAYDDPGGITAKFNLNLLKRINRELEADFNLQQFEHYQMYDPDNGACKSYLVSLQDQTVRIGPHRVAFARDETIFMEISQKYTPKEIEQMASEAGFAPMRQLSDSKGWFADVFWEAV